MHLADLIEGKDADEINPERLQDVEPLLDSGQQTRYSLGRNQAEWMTIKREHRPLRNPQHAGAV
jgi:hypothetical protein